jgi:hypothetical protein
LPRHKIVRDNTFVSLISKADLSRPHAQRERQTYYASEATKLKAIPLSRCAVDLLIDLIQNVFSLELFWISLKCKVKRLLNFFEHVCTIAFMVI